MIPVRPTLPFSPDTRVSLKLGELTAGVLRQAPDGWYAVLHQRGVEHRVWLKEASVIAETYDFHSTATSNFVRTQRVGSGEL